LPAEPDAATTLRAGADLVIASGDKLLGGPQAGLLLAHPLVERLRRHPLPGPAGRQAHLAALQATLPAPDPDLGGAAADPDVTVAHRPPCARLADAA
jgi:L-seryl-tRNA(Ser) seleniumtransferase